MTTKDEALKLALEALKELRMLGMNMQWHDSWLAKSETAITAIREALAEQPEQQECNHCGGTGDVSGEYPGVACPDCSGSGVQVKPEFFTHSVEQPYDWSEWVCPDPKGYLMKCCDCGLVHEAQFGVVRYKSEAEREGCDMVDDPNLQAVFRMRRSEQWSPEDTAHRAGGLPMAEQPAQQDNPHPEYCKGYAAGLEAGAISEKKSVQQQEPVAWINWCAATGKRSVSFECESELASQPLYEGITQNTQYHYSKFHSWFDSELHRQKYTKDHPAYLAAQEAWNAANDAAQHRINRLNAEIEAWKVRFKIAEDALAKLNGPEQKPVEYWTVADGWVSEQAEVPAFVWVEPDFWEHCKHVNCGTAYRLPAPGRQPLYTSPPASKPWVGLTDEEIDRVTDTQWASNNHNPIYAAHRAFARAIESKLKEKNNA